MSVDLNDRKLYQTAIINLVDIHIGERFRQDYGDLTAMQRSIKKHGLINPVTVSTAGIDADCPYTLIAGGRRISALAEMGSMEIPCRIYNHILSNLELRSIELEENLQRKQLDWQEQVKLQQEIHNLQISIHGKKTSTAPDAAGFSVTDTAKLLNRDKSSVSRDLKLADTVREFPEMDWNSCKTKSDALKMTKKLEEKMIRTELAKRAEKKLGSGNVRMSKLADAFVLQSFFDGVKKIPNESIDFVEMDPPYAIDLESNKRDYAYEDYNEIDPQFYSEFMQKAFEECYRVMAANSWLVCWFGPDPWFENIFTWLIEAGFSSIRVPGIWIKPNGQTNNPSKRLAYSYEMFFYVWKGSPVLAKPGSRNVFIHNPVPPVKKSHPTERPVTLITDILKTFTTEGSRVLVPFAGSGTTMIAASECQMIPIGYDISPQYRESYLVRLAEMFGKE
ncbi:ParB N-terminal domain-containing protein [Candidatus Pacearchaeota archaeon]|nr:ParB N-terminal domain-containing protein [Candidatus Pacearchaeota archaeon]